MDALPHVKKKIVELCATCYMCDALVSLLLRSFVAPGALQHSYISYDIAAITHFEGGLPGVIFILKIIFYFTFFRALVCLCELLSIALTLHLGS